MVQLTLLGILSLSLQVVICSLTIWAGVLLFRHRGAAGWMGLCGAILGTMATILAIASPWLGHIFHHPGSDNWLLLYQGLYMIAGVGDMIFLAGLVLYLLKKTAEAQRIEQLEAIIRDRDQVS